jgi:hypothetical protein
MRREEETLMVRSAYVPSIAAAAVVLAGCGGGEASEPNATSTHPLVGGVPQRSWLALKVASLDAESPTTILGDAPAPACSPGAPAELADLTRTVSTRANGMLGAVLQIVSDFTSHPPTLHGVDHATWGPVIGTEPTGTYRFDVHRLADGAIAFQLLGRKSDDDPWRGVFQGATRVVDAEHRAGHATLDLGNMHALDPVRNKAITGSVAIDFGNVDGKLVIDTTNAKYKFARRADGGGAFEFLAHSIDANTPAQKIVHVTTTWTPNGAGKSEATEVTSVQPQPATVVQCWAPNAGVLFQTNGGVAIGDPACCPL